MSSENDQITGNKTSNLFHCSECQLSFVFEAIWKKHMSIIHSDLIKAEQPISCGACSNVFSTHLSLKFHFTQKHKTMQSLTEKSLRAVPETCHICGITVRHMNMHLARSHIPPSDDIREKCKRCEFKGTKGTLERHFKQKHTIEICPFCAQVFKGCIDRHINNTNCGKDPIKSFPKVPCPQCKKVFKNKEMLKVHVSRIHNQVRDKQCDQCSYNTYSGGNLRLHTNKVHLGKKNEKDLCPHCNKMEGNLPRLIRIYHVEVE